MAQQKNKQNKQNKKTNQPASPEQLKPKTLKDLLLKAGLIFLIVIGCVWFTDTKGYFNPDYTNDHTRRKWNSFYKFTRNNPVDLVLAGNSHLYTGINPENLSTALGANCFILASPGTTMTDIYYSLKEAIAVKKPKIAVVETFGINDYASHELEYGALFDQYKSFSARKNTMQKLLSTPVLFNSRYYLAAWSNTIRNHNFIFSDQEQIQKNIRLNTVKEKEQPGLYLGRYIRFTSGLEEATLAKYDSITGLDGDKFKVSDEAREFVEKTVRLCEENQVKLVFLTLPMYYRHFKNADAYIARISEALEPYRPMWENQQKPYDYKAFTPDCFENTVSENQHMTYYGSLVSTYKLVSFIDEHLKGVLHDRSNDMSWKQLFYGNDGYFQNHSPENDGISQMLMNNETVGGLPIREILLVPSGGNKQLLLKVSKTGNSYIPIGSTVRITLDIDVEGQRQTVDIDAVSSYAYDIPGYYLFASSPLNPAIKGVSVKDVALLK